MTAQDTAMATVEPNRWSREEIDLIKRTVVPQGATDAEFKLLLYQAARTGLDPLSRQIHLVKRSDGGGGQSCTIQTGIDGFRVVAERTGKYEGQVGPYWCGADGQWREVWTDSEPPAAAKVGILRAGFREVVWGIAHWAEYAQYTKDGRLTRFWSKMGPLMLAKCAEAAAHRKAFPNDLSGIYTHEEMGQADIAGTAIDTTADEPKKAGRGQQKAERSEDTRTALMHALGAEIKRLGLTSEQAASLAGRVFKGAKSARDLSDQQVGALTKILGDVPDGTEDVAAALFGEEEGA